MGIRSGKSTIRPGESAIPLGDFRNTLGVFTITLGESGIRSGGDRGSGTASGPEAGKVPRRGLEPLHLAVPDPKSGASANFATSAGCGLCDGERAV